MKKSGENMKKSGENMKKSGEIGTKSSTGNEGKREKRLKFLKKKKEFYQKKLDNACKNDPFLSHYRDGIRAYEEELSVEYAQMRRFE